MVTVLFGAALPHVARVCAALLGPTLRTLALDRVMLRTTLDKVADALQGQAVTYAAMGSYTAAEQQDLVEGIRDGIQAVLTEKNVTVPASDVGRLLDAIVARAFPAGA
jgi:hypothetical protein